LLTFRLSYSCTELIVIFWWFFLSDLPLLLSGLLWTRHSLQWEPLCNFPRCMQSTLEKAIKH
jgi:hypothetical protein